MKININIEGEAKEIAALALELQGRQDMGKRWNHLTYPHIAYMGQDGWLKRVPVNKEIMSQIIKE